MSELQIVLVVIVVFGLIGYFGSMSKESRKRMGGDWDK